MTETLTQIFKCLNTVEVGLKNILKRRPTANRLGMLSLLTVLVGCGTGDAVQVTGQLLLAGKPVSGGRVTLLPIGDGKRAQSLVTESGDFAFRTEGNLGVVPGTYRIMYVSAFRPERPLGANQVSAEELSVIYQSPANEPIEIAPEQTEGLLIDIQQESRWTRSVSE